MHKVINTRIKVEGRSQSAIRLERGGKRSFCGWKEFCLLFAIHQICVESRADEKMIFHPYSLTLGFQWRTKDDLASTTDSPLKATGFQLILASSSSVRCGSTMFPVFLLFRFVFFMLKFVWVCPMSAVDQPPFPNAALEKPLGGQVDFLLFNSIQSFLYRPVSDWLLIYSYLCNYQEGRTRSMCTFLLRFELHWIYASYLLFNWISGAVGSRIWKNQPAHQNLIHFQPLCFTGHCSFH